LKWNAGKEVDGLRRVPLLLGFGTKRIEEEDHSHWTRIIL